MRWAVFLIKRRWRVRKLNHHIGFIPELISLDLFLDHFLLHKSQEDVEVANPVTHILLTWAAQETLRAFLSKSVKNLGITWGIGPIWDELSNLHAVLFVFSKSHLKGKGDAQKKLKVLNSRSHTQNGLLLLTSGVEFEDLSDMHRRSTKQKHDILGTHDSCSSPCSE